MKKFIIIAALAGSLAACATFPGTGGGPAPGPTDIVKQIQAIAVGACGFLPVASTVIGILNGNGAIMTAEAIAQAICGAVSGPRARMARSSGVPRVMGVPVRGRFVR